jgi:AraC-like DNA-binding protein
LSLSELARRLGTNTSHLSKAINQGLGLSFPDMINEMRAREVARRLTEQNAARSDLLDLAFESGFNSKASFNRAFRAVHGVSPSEFRAQARLRS